MLTARFSIFLCTQRGQTQPAKNRLLQLRSPLTQSSAGAQLLPYLLLTDEKTPNTGVGGNSPTAAQQQWARSSLISHHPQETHFCWNQIAERHEKQAIFSRQPPSLPPLEPEGIEMRCKICSPLNSPVFSACQTSDACQHPERRGGAFSLSHSPE